MKLNNKVVKNTYQDYIKKRPNGLSDKLESKQLNKTMSDNAKLVKKTVSNNVEISDKAKELAKNSIQPASLATSAITNLATSGLLSAAGNILPTGSEEKEKPEIIPKAEIEETNKVIKRSLKEGRLKKPAVFFITGLELFSSSNDYDGLKKMAEAIPEARLYDWDQKDEMILEIKKRATGQPIALIGHSFGGDTAVEIANELNSLENGFRQVDLLITLDSYGNDNDIIPQNVRKNVNIFGENSWLNDEPNVARDIHLTEVTNELRPEDHDELDNSKDVQYQIVTNINQVLKA